MATTLEHVPVGEIKPDPDQPRKTHDEGEHVALVESVKLHGILTPLTLRKNGSGYLIVAGERRWRAAKDAKLKTVPAQIIEAETAVVEALVENLIRTDLNPVEEGDAYLRLTETGLSPEAISRAVSRPKPRIEDRIELAQMPKLARDAIVDGRLSLHDAHNFARITSQDARLGALLCACADLTNQWHRDPWQVFFSVDQHDPSVREVPCEACGGGGYDDETDERCEKCDGRGSTQEKVEGAGWPEFFAWALWHATPLTEVMLTQLTPEAQARVAATSARAAEHDRVKRKASTYYYGSVPTPGLEDTVVVDAAVAAQVVVDFGNNRRVVIDPAFVSEYLPDAYDAQIDAWISPPRSNGTAKASGKALTPAQQQQKDERAKQRAKDAKARADARDLNTRLGVAIQTKLGEVPVTTDAMKLMVQTILDLTKHQQSYSPGKIGGDGHALYQRLTRNDWPTTKAGDYKLPRSSADRSGFVADVYKQTEKELAAAKTPEQALGVLVRFLAHGLVDLRGLPKADLDGMYPFRTQHGRWRAFVVGRLPKALRERLPNENGMKGSSHRW